VSYAPGMDPKMEPPEGAGSGAGVRFGCGALFGLFFGGGTLFVGHSMGALVAAALGGALVCGVLSVRYGDRFWESLSGWVRW
jgi:hypothetical protein